MGGQGFLLLMELKVLIMMTRPQNITRQATVMFCGLVIIIKTFNSINSRKPWPPILISHLFQHGLFLNSWPQLFYTSGVLVGIRCYTCTMYTKQFDCMIYIPVSNKIFIHVNIKSYISWKCNVSSKCLMSWKCHISSSENFMTHLVEIIISMANFVIYT